MKLSKLILIIPGIAALLFSLDLFLHIGEAATFDGPTHITTIYQVYEVMKSGEFPVTWLQNFARFGSPIPLYAHQTTMYLGAVLTFITKSPVMSYNIVTLVFSLIGSYGMYFLLRKHVSVPAALTGMLFFTFAPYRIINIYVRGAVPEFAAQSIIPLVMLCTFYFFSTKQYRYLILTAFSVAFLILTHTFVIIIALPIILLYTLYMARITESTWKSVLIFGISLISGVFLTGYYLVPLVTEVRYFHYGSEKNHYKPGQFLPLRTFFEHSWPYITETDRYTRPQIFRTGLFESLMLLLGVFYIFAKRLFSFSSLLFTTMIAAFLYIFFTSAYSEPLYTHVTMLGNIQHPWRMLSGYTVVVPIIIAYLVNTSKSKQALAVIMSLICITVYVPQLYGRNYTIKPISSYAYTINNLHGSAMNTVWSAESKEYTQPSRKVMAIEGKADIKPIIEKSGYRTFMINAETDTRIADATFYFPGWEVTSNGKSIPIEFQDMNYRGLITYRLPPGNQTVEVSFNPTKKRYAGMFLSAATLVAILVIGFIYNKKMK